MSVDAGASSQRSANADLVYKMVDAYCAMDADALKPLLHARSKHSAPGSDFGTDIEGGDTIQYLFEAEVFLHRDEAEQARAQRVGVLARRFYAELPAALASRNDRAPLSARERAAQRWKRTIH